MRLHSVVKAVAFIAVALAPAPAGHATSPRSQEPARAAVTSELALGEQVGKRSRDTGGQVGETLWDDTGGQVGKLSREAQGGQVG